MRPLRRVLTMVSLMVMAATTAYGDGILIPVQPKPALWPVPPPHPVEIPPPSIKYHRVNIQIRDQTAEIEVDQVFVNEFDREIEGLYIFPIPENAAISSFSMWADGKEIKGKILEAREAKGIYQSIVRKKKDPALLEYLGRDMFQASVFPIPPRGEKRIRLAYSELLRRDQDTVRLLYPLSTEKFSARPLGEVTIDVTGRSSIPVEMIYSPTHHISVRRDGDKKFTCGFEDKDVKPDKDFILYFTLSEDDIGMHLIPYNEGGQGYFMLLASPKPGQAAGPSLAKDIVFVVDSSGSMRGKKIEQAKNAAVSVLKGLDERDRFDIIDFDNGVSWFREGLVPADKSNIDAGLAFVGEIDASGGTNIHAAVTGALKALAGSDRPGYVIFLTDGEPTVGVTDESDILKKVREANASRTRVFVFGVGYDVNTRLLDRMASENHGAPQYVKPDENIEVSVSSLYDKIASPVLSQVKLSIEGVTTRDVYPTDMPDLFKGSQLVVLGRYSGKGKVKATLSGKVGAETRRFSVTVPFGEREEENPFIPRIWASRRIAFLLEELRLNGESRELVDEVRELGMRFGIVTPYTSFLVTEDEKEEIARKDMAAPSMAPMNQAFMGSSKADMAEVAGARGVAQSLRLKKARESRVETRLHSARIKYVKERTFHLSSDTWIDSLYREGMKEITVAFGSEAYFKLINDRPDIAPYLSAGPRCIVVAGDVAYRITSG